MRLHGVPAEEVAQQLGHRRLGTTGVYTEYDPAYLKAACRALENLTCQILASAKTDENGKTLKNMVLPEGIELSTSPLPRECSTTELRQLIFDFPNFFPSDLGSAGEILASTACKSPSNASDDAALRYSGSYSV
jgi:hypothetical protein